MQKVKQFYFAYKYLIRDLSLYLAANLVQVAIGVLMNPVLASNMSSADFAIIGYYDSFTLFILPLIGFSSSSYYARNYFNWNEEERKKSLNTLLLFQAIAGFGSAVLLLAVLKLYFFYNHVIFSFYPFALFSFGVLFVQNFYSFYLLNLRLNKKATIYFRTSIVYNFINVLIVFVFVVYLKYGALGRMGGLFLGAFILGTYSFFRQVSAFEIDFKIVSRALRFCWPLMFSALLTYFFTGFEKLLLERVKDIHSFGLYSIASRIISYFIIFSMSIDAAFESDYYRAIAGKNYSRLGKVVLSTLLIKIIPVLLFLAMAGFVTGILTNYRYTEAAPFARILALSSILQSVSFTFSILLVSLGFPRLALAEKITGAIIIVVMDFVLIHKYGFNGAAWGQVLGYGIMSSISIGLIFYLYKKQKLFNRELS